MVHYIIDGYNLIKQSAEFTGGRTLRASREELINYLCTDRPQGSTRNLVTVVFDGKEDVYVPKLDLSREGIRILFSCGCSADERIYNLARNSARKRELVVITDDKLLRAQVRALGVKVRSISEFTNKRTKNKIMVKEDRNILTVRERNEITNELLRKWVIQKNPE